MSKRMAPNYFKHWCRQNCISVFVGLMTYLRYLCYLRIMVSNIYCVVFLLCLSSSCVLYTQCCQFLWIVHVSLTSGLFCEIIVTTFTEQLIHADFTNKQNDVISSQVNGYVKINWLYMLSIVCSWMYVYRHWLYR
jgi:hypothetical protein